MTKNDIITEIYNSNLFEKMASTYNSKLGSYKEDWIQHMYLTLCELPENKLLELYEKKELNYYLFYVGKAVCFNDKSNFWKEYKGRIETISYDADNKQLSDCDYDYD